MKKIIKNEQDVNQISIRAKRFLTTFTAATLAGMIIVESMGYPEIVNAQEKKPTEAVGTESDLVKELDSAFTWRFDVDDGVDRDLVAGQESALSTNDTKEEKAEEKKEEKAEAEEKKEEKAEEEKAEEKKEEKAEEEKEEEKEEETSKGNTAQGNVTQGNEDECGPKKYVKVNVSDDQIPWEWSDERAFDNPDEEYLLYLPDVDPAKVDENYTGVAPLTYYGPEHVVKNYGDASNDEEVKERAMMFWNAFHRANEEAGGLKIVDVDTGKEYTVEKIMNIIKYINGAYVAIDGADAKEINDDWLNFMLVFLNDDYIIEEVEFAKGNSDTVTNDDIVKHSNILENVDLGHLLMGDSANGPFLQWFGDQIKAMYTATEFEEAVRIFDETYLAIVAITEGNGYIINGVKYTINDFSNVNDLVLETQVNISEALKTNMMEAGYAFNKKYVGLDFVFLTDVLIEHNPLCADDLVEKLKNGGVNVYEGVVTHGNGENLNLKNYAYVMQMKAFNMALANKEYGISYYQDSYLDHYEEYLEALGNGTYEGVLESSEYVYKLK